MELKLLQLHKINYKKLFRVMHVFGRPVGHVI